MATQEGVTRLPSGLLYKVESAGSGAYPTTESRVQVHYRGTLHDGTTFDSSYDRGSPATFGVTQVIKGWTEALLAMREGDKCKQTTQHPTGTADTYASTLVFVLTCCIACIRPQGKCGFRASWRMAVAERAGRLRLTKH